jgi:hypothetical protein
MRCRNGCSGLALAQVAGGIKIFAVSGKRVSYHLPVFGIDFQGSCGGRGEPF